MKPCIYEQEMLFGLHGMASGWQRVRAFFHRLGCASCRRRREEFALATRALASLGPAGPRALAIAPDVRRNRLILCSAAIAIAAAALSYYFSYDQPGSSAAQTDSKLCLPIEETPQSASKPKQEGKAVRPSTESVQ
jgi:hypothetical protein